MMSFKEYWIQRNPERHLSELAKSFELMYQTSNLVFASSFTKVLRKPVLSTLWAKHDDKIALTLSRAYDQFIVCDSHFLSLSAKHLSDLREFEKKCQLGVSIKRKGMVKSLNRAEFLFALACYFAKQYSHFLYELRDHVSRAATLLMLRDTLQNGFELGAFNNITSNLFDNKPATFFSEGYPVDFFVADRMSSYSLKTGIWLCYQERLSTGCMSKASASSVVSQPDNQNKMVVAF
ncbi:TPA: hypothetical protein ACGUU0_004125 [Vibrio vulnificus]